MQSKTFYREDIYQGSLILVNSQYPYVLKDTRDHESIDFSFQHQMDRQTARLLKQCFDHLHIQDEIKVTSAYRSSQQQDQLYQQSLKEHGEVYTRQFVALPHHSEHETGFAIDLALNQDYIDLICPSFPDFGICQQFRNLCYDYGFIERYAEDKEHLTSIAKEEWHFRYVGFPHSLIMKNKNLCLEEYHDFIKNYSIYEPFTYVVNQRIFDIFYVPIHHQKTTITLRSDAIYQTSGNNMDGMIVTVWRRGY